MNVPIFPPFNRQKECRHGLMLYNMYDKYIGGSLDLYGEYSEGEVEVFTQIIRPGDVVVEAGANIGAHTVFLAKHVGPTGRVYAFEPQRVVFQTLCANIALNNLTNVYCMQQALGSQDGTVLIPLFDYTRKNNYGGVHVGDFKFGEPVPVVTVDSLNLHWCNFLKVDVEGMEQAVLQGAANLISRARPILYVENDKKDQSDDLVRYIDSLDYNMFWHKTGYYSSNNLLGNPDNVFPNEGSFNMLCVPKGMPCHLEGMPQVPLPSPP
jgi:FkbM family methyltransferase